jgi:hypothetical protein
MLKFATDNLVGLIGILIGVLVAAYTYYRSVKERIPAYVVPWRTRIVDKRLVSAPSLQLLYDGQPITGQDITSATVYFWNGGREPIRKADVMREYAFYLGEDGKLLHANILKATRTECGISVVLPVPATNRVALNFDVLEYGDGVGVQLIFSGDPDTPIDMAGVCVGAEKIRNATRDYRSNSFQHEQFFPRTSLSLFMALAGITVVVISFRAGDWPQVGVGLLLATLGLFGLFAILRSSKGSYYASLKRLAETKSQA